VLDDLDIDGKRLSARLGTAAAFIANVTCIAGGLTLKRPYDMHDVFPGLADEPAGDAAGEPVRARSSKRQQTPLEMEQVFLQALSAMSGGA
jgi:hypothetical protein